MGEIGLLPDDEALRATYALANATSTAQRRAAVAPLYRDAVERRAWSAADLKRASDLAQRWLAAMIHHEEGQNERLRGRRPISVTHAASTPEGKRQRLLAKLKGRREAEEPHPLADELNPWLEEIAKSRISLFVAGPSLSFHLDAPPPAAWVALGVALLFDPRLSYRSRFIRCAKRNCGKWYYSQQGDRPRRRYCSSACAGADRQKRWRGNRALRQLAGENESAVS
jgi:hypothetical protein